MTDTAIYKARLQEELKTITTDLQELGIHNPEVAEDWIPLPPQNETNHADENVAADRAEDLEEHTATLAELETRYNNIRLALAKIESGTFGICEVNGEEIEEERLNANPSARTSKAHIEEEPNLA